MNGGSSAMIRALFSQSGDQLSLQISSTTNLRDASALDAHYLKSNMLEFEYAQFKENIIKEIRQDEEQYAKLQDEIKALEAEIEAEARNQSNAVAIAKKVPSQPAFDTVKDGEAIVNEASPQAAEPTAAAIVDTKTERNTPVPQPQPIQPPLDKPIPVPSPPRNEYGSVSEQQSATPVPLPHNARPPHNLPGMSPMRLPLEVQDGHRRTPSGSGPGRGSPLPYPPQQQFQQYGPYNPPPQHWPPQQPFPSGASPQFYHHGPPGQPLQHSNTPLPPQYQYYPQLPPGQHFNRGQPTWQPHPPIPYSPYVQPPSAASTPRQRKNGTPAQTQAPGSSTPWKRKYSSLASLRAPSPEAPRDVSPLTDVGSPETEPQPKTKSTKAKGNKRKQDLQQQEQRSSRRRRTGSAVSSTVDRSSRSQSLASFTSDARPEASTKGRRGGTKIKPEPPSTPAPFPSETDNHHSSGRRRTRGDTLMSYDALGRPNLKRKRDELQQSSAEPSSPIAPPVVRQRSSVDPNLVAVSKTFSRVGSQLLNRITEHKFASIFAKPLSERDAPGYKDLIQRPQDLKTIKAAITKGSKAAIAAIDEIEQESGGVPTLVKKTEDLIPPKGIVNIDQLEMELMRMFANAVMFNPLSDSERGLGNRRNMWSSATPSQNGELGYATSEEGGIIQDAREMFEDVVGLIETFRAAEQDKLGEEAA